MTNSLICSPSARASGSSCRRLPSSRRCAQKPRTAASARTTTTPTIIGAKLPDPTPSPTRHSARSARPTECPGRPLSGCAPLGPDEAPPEEPRDAEAAGLVAPWARVKTLIAFRRGERRVEQLAAGAVRAQPQRLVTASGAAAARAATTATTAATAPTRRRQRKSIGLDHRVVRPAAAPVQDGTEAGAPPLAATNTSTRWGGAPTAVIRAPPSMPPARG
jgi:hypothetical protein